VVKRGSNFCWSLALPYIYYILYAIPFFNYIRYVIAFSPLYGVYFIIYIHVHSYMDVRSNSRSICTMIKFKDFKVYNAISPIDKNKTVNWGTLRRVLYRYIQLFRRWNDWWPSITVYKITLVTYIIVIYIYLYINIKKLAL